MSQTQRRQRASHARCARRSLVELTAAASRAVDDELLVLSSGFAAPNPRPEHTGEKASDQTILASQATAPGAVAVLQSRNAAALRKDVKEFHVDAVELIVQKEPADSAEQPQPQYMR